MYMEYTYPLEYHAQACASGKPAYVGPTTGYTAFALHPVTTLTHLLHTITSILWPARIDQNNILAG